MGVKVVLAVYFVLLITLSAPAAPLAYEPFAIGANPALGQYTVGPLAGQNPTNSFFTGTWVDRDPVSLNDSIQATGLSYLGAPSTGGSEISAPNSTPLRNLTSPLTATTVGTFYIGYEASFGAGNYTDGTDGNDMGYRAIEFRGTDGSFQFGVAYNAYNGGLGAVNQDPTTGRMVLDHGGLQIINNSPDSFVADNGVTHLIVLKLVLSDQAASDSVSLYLDPTDATEPVVPGALFTGADLTLGSLGGFTIFGGTGTFPVLDELRVGTTFADAVPVFPAPGDTNGDMLVNQADYLNIFHAMNLIGAAIPNTPTNHPDVNGDGKVNIADYRLWKDHRTDIPFGAGAASGGQVPEPTSLLLVLIGVALIAVTRFAPC
jgi:hypothetical protein